MLGRTKHKKIVAQVWALEFRVPGKISGTSGRT
jgi:hypothetical protein